MDFSTLLLAFFFVLISCGKGIETPLTDSKCDSSLALANDVAGIVSKTGSGRCSGCHEGKYDSFIGLKKEQGNVYQEVSSGKMPIDSDVIGTKSGFKDTADGKKMLSWLGCKSLK